MSSDSYLTIYRKYNQKINDVEFNGIINKYVEFNKEFCVREKNTTDEYHVKNIPIILDPYFNMPCDRLAIEKRRENYQYVLSTDKSHLDKLISWHFGSTFTCLRNEFNLNGHTFEKFEYIIDERLAEQILQACKYLLSKQWSDEMEEVLSNKWIDILSTENVFEYWKYIYRNNIKRLAEIYNENSESNEIEIYLRQLRTILETYLYNYESEFYLNESELILVYSVYD